MLSLQIAFAGGIMMAISEKILNKQVMKLDILLSRHREPWIIGFQIASRGEQEKMVTETPME